MVDRTWPDVFFKFNIINVYVYMYIMPTNEKSDIYVNKPLLMLQYWCSQLSTAPSGQRNQFKYTTWELKVEF